MNNQLTLTKSQKILKYKKKKFGQKKTHLLFDEQQLLSPGHDQAPVGGAGGRERGKGGLQGGGGGVVCVGVLTNKNYKQKCKKKSKQKLHFGLGIFSFIESNLYYTSTGYVYNTTILLNHMQKASINS